VADLIISTPGVLGGQPHAGGHDSAAGHGALRFRRARRAPVEQRLRECTCVTECKGQAGLAPGWVCGLRRAPPTPEES
jgi:hypothetical protein